MSQCVSRSLTESSLTPSARKRLCHHELIARGYY
jgi:hypothetical protein